MAVLFLGARAACLASLPKGKCRLDVFRNLSSTYLNRITALIPASDGLLSIDRRDATMIASDRFNGLSKRSAIIIGTTIIVGLAHHTDHVLRVDHSGWPFRHDVNPFTFSLLAYPILLFVLLGPARLFWARWSIFPIATGFTLLAHTMIETPAMQYAMWTHDHSLEPLQPDAQKLLRLQSSVVGDVAVALAMTLNLLLVAGVLSMLSDGLKRRQTTLAA